MTAPLENRRSWPTLLAVAGLACLFAFAHPSVFSQAARHMPGIGLTLSAWALLGLCVYYLGCAHLRRSLPLLLGAALLSATYALFGNDTLKLMNLPATIALMNMSADALAGQTGVLRADAMGGALRRLFLCLPRQLGAPFHMLKSARCFRDRRLLRPVLQGLLICVPVVAVVLILLCSADSTFRDALRTLLTALEWSDPALRIWQTLCAMLVTLLLFAWIVSAQHREIEPRPPRRPALIPLSIEMLLFTLSLIYGAFLFIQCASTPQPEVASDYADQARAGFFQLVLVALITLMVVLPSLSTHREKRALRILCALVSLLTLGLLASALVRMIRYIRGYGWTFLRTVTLWGILVIAAALFAALAKCMRPKLRICRFLTVFVLSTWILFNYANVDARIAEANVSAYQNRRLPKLDIEYLGRLSPDVLPALQTLDEHAQINTVHLIEQQFSLEKPAWYDWSLSWKKLDPEVRCTFLGKWQLVSVDGERAFRPSEDVWQMVEFKENTTGLFWDSEGNICESFRWQLCGNQIFGTGIPGSARSEIRHPCFQVLEDCLYMKFQYGERRYEYRRSDA